MHLDLMRCCINMESLLLLLLMLLIMTLLLLMMLLLLMLGQRQARLLRHAVRVEVSRRAVS